MDTDISEDTAAYMFGIEEIVIKILEEPLNYIFRIRRRRLATFQKNLLRRLINRYEQFETTF
jgi:hypothetical protein